VFSIRNTKHVPVRSVSTFGYVLVRRSKQTIIQSEREFGVTWGKAYKIINSVAIVWLWTKWSLISIELQQSNRPVNIYYWPGLNACRKMRIALTSPSRSCDANFISLLLAARVISPDSSSSCLVCDYYIMWTFEKTALWSQLSIFVLLPQSISKALKWKEMSSNILQPGINLNYC